MPEETVPREGMIWRDSFLEVGLYLCQLRSYVRSLCMKMTFISGAVLDFGMVRSKGNVRFGNVARVPARVLTHLVQSADSPCGSRVFHYRSCMWWGESCWD